MEQLFINMAWNVIIFLVAVLFATMVRYAVEKIGIEKMNRGAAEWDNVKDLAYTAVKYAEQAYREYGGATKKEQALAFLSRELAQLGIRLSAETLDGIIEAMLRDIKDNLGEQWAAAIKDETAKVTA